MSRSQETQPRAGRLRLLQAGLVAVGVVAALVLLAVVVRLVPAYLREQPYAGALFLVPTALLAIVAFDLPSGVRRRGMWRVGAAACLGIAVVYVASLAFEPPSGYDASWRVRWIVAGLAAVAAYLLALTGWSWADHARSASARTASRRRLIGVRTHDWRVNRRPTG